jgi:hypothetical protein
MSWEREKVPYHLPTVSQKFWDNIKQHLGIETHKAVCRGIVGVWVIQLGIIDVIF